MVIVRRFLLAALLLPVVTGCISNKEMAERKTLGASADRVIICKAGTDCDEKWHRAQQWLRTYATYPLTTQTDNLIETAGPSGLFDDHLAFTVTKKHDFQNMPQTPASSATPQVPATPAPDTYTITLFARCNNWFDCTPSQLEARANFTTFVIGAPVVKPPLGVKVTPVSLEMAQKMGMSGAQGVAITAITPHSLADKAGLSEGDIIVHYNGTLVLTETALNDLVANTEPGQRTSLDVIRGKAHQTVFIDFPAASSPK